MDIPWILNLSSKKIISSIFSLLIKPIKSTLSFNIGNNLTAIPIFIIELSLSFAKALKSDLSIIVFFPILK